MSKAELVHMNTVGPALLGYSRDGTFPDEDTSAAEVVGTSLHETLEGLQAAKSELEIEIRAISKEVAPDVESWMAHAKRLQNDIDRSRRLASEIVQQAEAEERRVATLQDAETYACFLEREGAFIVRLEEALGLVVQATDALNKTEKLVGEGQILNGLKSLDDVSHILRNITTDRSVKLVSIFEIRVDDLRKIIHDQIKLSWMNYVVVDSTKRSIFIHEDPSALTEILIGLQSFDEVTSSARALWLDFYGCILRPCLDIVSPAALHIEGNRCCVTAGNDISSLGLLLGNLESILNFLSSKIPGEIIKPFSEIMMPTIFAYMGNTWLDQAVPAALEHVSEYKCALTRVSSFAEKLEYLKWPGGQDFHDWASNGSSNWLSKRREVCLDLGRKHLALGLGSPKHAEHSEHKSVGYEEGAWINFNDDTTADDWDIGWGSGDEEDEVILADGSQARSAIASKTDDGDGVDAWGWGDDESPKIASPDDAQTSAKCENPIPTQNQDTQTRQLTLTEKYWTSSMPCGVISIISGLFEDADTLLKKESEKSPIRSAAAGLISIATLVLAEYRAISPLYYANNPVGPLYAYNDAIWLCDSLKDLKISWVHRPDLNLHLAHGLQKLDPEIRCLESFGRRAYCKEMDTHRLVLNDQLGGTQNFLQLEGMGEGADAVVNHVKQLSTQWRKILAPSIWRSAIGSLINTVSHKIITDVFELTDISVDEAESIAKIIAKITALDSLFNSSKVVHDGEAITSGRAPLMAEYADQWLKLQFLSEVLQSNLNDIRWLWFDSELSMHFSKDEVIELIHLSFENNNNVRGAVREIRERPLLEMAGRKP